ncbi:hypothetical protein [Mucilaginibacter aquatilis]|uniref:Uncharacterized protein n=1 Tax=Mucilaginibacter aquatilis TaxID=1517760 RepID=A0A6I4IRA0_9SPHI|nr:hypothetical protein [Mucilaginibacter aquatilis]MVN93133.1 hypothetical protein [Mucilaginibacter aquatilis]
MDKRIHDYIESGILEAFVTGATSANEEREVLQMKKQFPEVEQALNELEIDMEKLAMRMASPPPPQLWDRIESEINGLTVTSKHLPQHPGDESQRSSQHNHKPDSGFIEVEGSSTHMRIHKVWRWVFAAVFILGKVFLGFAIYYYLENRQAKENIQELKLEIRQLKSNR